MNRVLDTAAVAAALSLSWACAGPPPSVDAGEAIVVTEGSLVRLQGVTQGAERIEWRQTSGPEIDIRNTRTLETFFIAPEIPIGTTEVIEIALIAQTRTGLESSDTVKVTVHSQNYLTGTANLDGTRRLYSYDAEVGALTVLSDPNSQAEVLGWRWSPDRSRIVYWDREDRVGRGQFLYPFNLYTVAPDGTGRTRIPRADLGNGYYVELFGGWTDDSSRLVYHCRPRGAIDAVCSTTADGTETVFLIGPTGPNEDQTVTAWGGVPGSKYLVYLADPPPLHVYDAYRIRFDGTGLVKLTDMQYGDAVTSLSFLRDGRTLLFNAETSGVSSLFATPLDELEPPRQLSGDDEVVTSASWAALDPTRTRLYYRSASIDGESRFLNVARLDGSTHARLFTYETFAGATFPWTRWSPDGTTLYFAAPVENADSSVEYEMLRVEPSGSDTPIRMTDRLFTDWAWQDRLDPIIARGSTPGGAHALYAIRAEPPGEIQLSDPGVDVDDWTLSPDESHVAYWNAAGTLSLTAVETPSPMTLAGTVLRVRWLSDGSRLLFESRNRFGDYNLYSVRPDGSDQVQLNTSPMQPSRWGPSQDTSLVVYTNTDNELCLVAPDGTGHTVILQGLTQDSFSFKG